MPREPQGEKRARARKFFIAPGFAESWQAKVKICGAIWAQDSKRRVATMPISLILLAFLVPLMSLGLLRATRQGQRMARAKRSGRGMSRAPHRGRAEVAQAILRRRQHRQAVLHRVLHPPP